MLLGTGSVKSKYSGRFYLEIYNPETDTTRTHEQENLITDWGLEAMATQGNNFVRTCMVGSGSTAPAFSDLSLVNEIARAGTTYRWPYFDSSNRPPPQGVTAYDATDPNNIFLRCDLPFVFAKGAAAGNLTELGMGNANGLFSRTLIKDPDGNPTSITVLPIEVLTVTYRHRHHVPNEVWVQENVEITGNKPWVGKVTCRPVRAGFSTNHWDSGSQYGHLLMASEIRDVGNGTVGYETNEPLAITTQAIAKGHGVTGGEYLGNLVAKHNISFGINQGNFPTGLGTICVQLGGLSYQFQFEPKLPKTNLDELTMSFLHTWGRYVEP